MSGDVLIEKDAGWFDPREYTTIPNRIVRDRGLSFEARGLLTYIASHVPGWQVRMTDLQREGNCGRDRIRRIVQELEQAGYLVRLQSVEEGGRFGVTRYRLRSRRSRPVTENPATGEPSTDDPTPENTTPYKKPIPLETHEQNPSRGDATADAAGPGDQDVLDLDVEPTPPPEPAPREGAALIVATYVQAYQGAHGRRPVGPNIGKIGRDARALLRDPAADEAEVIEAAAALGRDGRWNDLPRQIDLMRTGGRPPAERGRLGPAPVGRPGKFDDMPDDELIEPAAADR